MRRVETSLSEEDYVSVSDFCKKNDISVYALLKKALFLYIQSADGLQLEAEGEVLVQKISEDKDFIQKLAERKDHLFKLWDVVEETPVERFETLIEHLSRYYDMSEQEFADAMQLLDRVSKSVKSSRSSDQDDKAEDR